MKLVVGQVLHYIHSSDPCLKSRMSYWVRPHLKTQCNRKLMGKAWVLYEVCGRVLIKLMTFFFKYTYRFYYLVHYGVGSKVCLKKYVL